MAQAKVHYNAEVPGKAIVSAHRVASLCGAITVHSTPQLFVQETSFLPAVTCKNCLRRVAKASATS